MLLSSISNSRTLVHNKLIIATFPKRCYAGRTKKFALDGFLKEAGFRSKATTYGNLLSKHVVSESVLKDPQRLNDSSLKSWNIPALDRRKILNFRDIKYGFTSTVVAPKKSQKVKGKKKEEESLLKKATSKVPEVRLERPSVKKEVASVTRNPKPPGNSPFLYGKQNFRKFGDGYFFRDNSRYIAIMEALDNDAVVSLHPRRFGKSLFISVLQEYYDIRNKHCLKELFKGCYIADHLTPKAGSFLVLALDFSGIKTDTFAVFEQDFNEKNNITLNDFLGKYKKELQLISFDEKNTDFVNNFMKTYRHALQKGFKSLSNQLLLTALGYKKDDMKQVEAERIENGFRRFFSRLKEANKGDVYVFVSGVSPLCLNEFTSGWNHAVRISDMPEFAGLYGLEESDVNRGLDMIIPPLPKDMKEKLLEHCRKSYDGYCFHPDGTTGLFNPGRIMYFLENVNRNWIRAKEKQLSSQTALFQYLVSFKDDSQTRISPAAFKCVKASPAAKTLLLDLLKEDKAQVTSDEDVDAYFRQSTLQERHGLLSFMYYMGALTYAGPKSFCIPNPDAKLEFVETTLELLDLDESVISKTRQALELWLENGDISQLCKSFEIVGQRERGARDFKDIPERAFQEGELMNDLTISVVCDRLLLCRKPGDTLEPEYVVDKTARMSKNHDFQETIDVMYTSKKNNRRFGLELKQIGVQFLYDLRKQPWENWKETSETISTMTDDEVLKLTFNKNTKQEEACSVIPNKTSPYTIGDYMNVVVNDVRSKYMGKLQASDKEDGVCSVWVAMRVGLGKVMYQKAFPIEGNTSAVIADEKKGHFADWKK